MLPLVLLGGAAAAFLLSGCSQQKKPELLSSPPKPPPPPSLPKNFGDDKVVTKTYEELSKAGVTDLEMDQGCHEIHYNQPGPNETVVGKGDQRLDACEVYEYALDRYEKYWQIVEGITGKPIPWSLDDHDDKTDFDENIRLKVNGTINTLRNTLTAQGLKPEDEAYQEKLAVGLFYYALFPSNPMKIINNREQLRTFTAELETLQMKGFQDSLFYLSGLGLMEMEQDAPMEATALETLNQKNIKEGACTEKSKVLYAVDKMAGLKPFFAFTPGQEALASLPERKRDLVDPSMGHMFIGVSLGNRSRYYDPSAWNSNAQYHNFYPFRLIHYWASDLINQGSYLSFNDQQFDEAKKKIRLAIRFDPLNPLTYANLGFTFFYEKKIKEAIDAFQKAAELGSNQSDYSTALANLLLKTDRLQEAATALEQVLKDNHEDASMYMVLGILHGRNSAPDKAEAAFRKAIEIKPHLPEAQRNLAVALLRQSNKWEEAIEAFYKAIEDDPQDTQAHLDLAKALMMKGSSGLLDSAYRYVKKALEISPNHEEAKSLLAEITQRQEAAKKAPQPAKKKSVQKK